MPERDPWDEGSAYEYNTPPYMVERYAPPRSLDDWWESLNAQEYEDSVELDDYAAVTREINRRVW